MELNLLIDQPFNIIFVRRHWLDHVLVCSSYASRCSVISHLLSLRCSRRCWKSGRGGSWARTLTRSIDTPTATRRTSRAAALPWWAISPRPTPAGPTQPASANPQCHAAEGRPAPWWPRRTAYWWSPTVMVRGKGSPPRPDTAWCSPSCHTMELLAKWALPQRTCVWKRGRSAAHTVWKEKRRTSENGRF